MLEKTGLMPFCLLGWFWAVNSFHARLESGHGSEPIQLSPGICSCLLTSQSKICDYFVNSCQLHQFQISCSSLPHDVVLLPRTLTGRVDGLSVSPARLPAWRRRSVPLERYVAPAQRRVGHTPLAALRVVGLALILMTCLGL